MAKLREPASYFNRSLTEVACETLGIAGWCTLTPNYLELGIVVPQRPMDLRTSKIRYVVLLGGGVRGIGDKLFAIPFDDFKLPHTM